MINFFLHVCRKNQRATLWGRELILRAQVSLLYVITSLSTLSCLYCMLNIPKICLKPSPQIRNPLVFFADFFSLYLTHTLVHTHKMKKKRCLAIECFANGVTVCPCPPPLANQTRGPRDTNKPQEFTSRH